MNALPVPEARFRSLSKAFPDIPEASLDQAEASLDRYLAIVLRIYDRLVADPADYARFKVLTAFPQNAEMDGCADSPRPTDQQATRPTQS